MAVGPFEGERMSDDDTGMASAGSIAHYLDSTYGTVVSGMSAHDRAEQLMHEVNSTLHLEGVPPVAWEFGAPADSYGSFDAARWTMYLNEHYFAPEGADAAALEANYREALQTVYHEARHAEQAFRGARERIGLGASVAQVVEAMGPAHNAPAPPQWVVEQAAQHPILQCDYSQYQAEAWYQSRYGTGAGSRDGALTNPDDPGYDAAYRALPEEADGWRTDGMVGEAYRRFGQAQP
jgi:hypothetical protein